MMGTSNYNLPLVSGAASAKVPRDLNALAVALDGVLGAHNDIISEHTSQLAKQTKQANQPDYVEFLRAHNQTEGKLKAKRTSARNFEVMIPLANGKYQRHLFVKDPNDNFIKHGEISLATFEYGPSTQFYNYTSINGSGWNTATNNRYTTNVNDTMTFNFVGTGLDFYAFHDTRGGIWEFVIDGGAAITISTHINTAVDPTGVASTYKKIIATNLAEGTHTVIATYKGADPNNPPTSSGSPTTARGWAYFRSADQSIATFGVLASALSPFNKLLVGGSASNKEFAIGVKPATATYGTAFVPDHGTATAFPTYQKLSFGGIEKDLLATDADYTDVESVKLVQVVNGVHPNDPANILCEIHIIHTINHSGVNCKLRIEFLRATLADGYVAMFPSQNTFAKRFLVSTGQTIEAIKADDSYTDVNDGEFAKSFAFLNDMSTDPLYADTMFAMTINDINKTFRNGEPGRRTPVIWLRHRTSIQKLYPEVLDSKVMQPGESIQADYTMYVGQIDFANKMFI